MAGEMAGITEPAMQKMALLSPIGATFAARVLGLIQVAIGLRGATASAPGRATVSATPHGSVVRLNAAPSATALALLGTLMVITSFTLMGHTTTTPHRIVAAAQINLHMLVVAIWLSSHWPQYLAAKQEFPT